MPVRPESQPRIFVEVVNNWDVPGLRTCDTNTTEWISSTVRPHQASHRRPKGLCFANPMLIKLRSASSAARSFIQDYLPKPPMRAKVTLLITHVVWGLWHPYQNAVGTLTTAHWSKRQSSIGKRKVVSIWLWRAKPMQGDFEWSDCLAWAPLPSSYMTVFVQIVVSIYSDHHKGAGEVTVSALAFHS